MALGTTVGDLVERVRRDNHVASRGPIYTLGANYTAGGATLELTETPQHIGPGSVVSVDYEMFYVQGLNVGTKTLTVIPAYWGTTNVNHSQNAIVEVDPRMPRNLIMDFAQQEILSWGKELWRTVSIDVPVLSGDRAFDLGIVPGETIYFLLDARTRPTGDTSEWWNWSWTDNAWPRARVRLVRGMLGTTEFPSGYSIQFMRRLYASTTLRLAYAGPFDLSTFDDTTDLIGDVGLQQEWIEVVELGAKYRALDGLVAGRTDWRAGGMSREAEEVSSLDCLRAASQAMERRVLRFTKAAVDLRGDWPYRETI